MRPIKVGNKSIKKAVAFAFDGCHKVYLLTANEDQEDIKAGWGYSIYPISQLEEVFLATCPLRLIRWWDTLDAVVPQFTPKVTITYDDGAKSTLTFR